MILSPLEEGCDPKLESAWLKLAHCFWRRRWKVKLERRMKMWTKPMQTTHNTIRTRCSWATSLTQETLDFLSINTSAQNMMIPYCWLRNKKNHLLLENWRDLYLLKNKKKNNNKNQQIWVPCWHWTSDSEKEVFWILSMHISFFVISPGKKRWFFIWTNQSRMLYAKNG